MVFANPDVAWVLLIMGVLGVYVELCSPGWVLPGVAGGVLAMLSAASLVRMNPHFEGVLLLIFGMTLLWIRGICGVAGAAALVWGAMLLVDGIHLAAALSSCVPFAMITVFLLSTARRARQNKQALIAIQPR